MSTTDAGTPHDGREAAVPAGGPEEPSPFGGGEPATRRKRLIGVGAAVVVIAAAAAGAYFATRGGSEIAADAGMAGPGAMAADSAVAMPVELSAEQARRIGVTYATAEVGPLTKEIRTVGQVAYDETRVKAISPKIDGWVEQLFVNYTGQLVRPGDPLLTIYSPMLVTAQEELRLAKRLEADVAAGTPDARRGAAELVESARRRLAYWDISAAEIERIERSGEVLRTLTLRAPAGGFVVEKNVLAGQRIMAGDALYRVADLSTVWVEGEVFEQDLAAVRTGQQATAEFQALPGERRAGRITYVYPTLNTETRTVRVRVELPNPGLRLKPGMYATLRVAGATRARVLSVPRSAVLATGERSVVFVRAASGRLEPREVAVGQASDVRVEIVRGLTGGETVVSSATFLVDAESNLGSAMGGMGNMPGMDMGPPAKVDRPQTAPVQPTAPGDGMKGMDMKGMDMKNMPAMDGKSPPKAPAGAPATPAARPAR